MAVPFYMDANVPQAITDQLRRHGVNALTAWDDGYGEASDEQVLQRATELGRVVFTQDIRFKARAATWLQDGRRFGGLLFGHQLGGTIGQYVRDLRLIDGASDTAEWVNVIDHLPFD
ncbi:MAG: hypothetical protein QOE14_665 [Humisphaera sp.]|nr:hypothetical protein [Humisphaera sp.]